MGATPVGSNRTVTVPVTNAGNSPLSISDYQTDNVYLSTVEIPVRSTGELTLTISPRFEGSFVDEVSVQGNGGIASLQVFGTTYQLPKASTTVYLDGTTPLSTIVRDKTIHELSVAGTITLEDWEYIALNLPNLEYLDFSEATWMSNVFPTYSFVGSLYAFKDNLRQLNLPMNIRDVSYGAQSLFSASTNLQQIVLPVRLEQFRADLTQCSSLSSIISFSPKPPFFFYDLDNIQTVYVPSGAVSAYEQSSFNQTQIREIDQEVLNGGNRKITQLDIIDPEYRNGTGIVDYHQELTHTRLYIPSHLLNLPIGTTIDAFTFYLKVYNYNNVTVNPGTIWIGLAQVNSKEEAMAATSFLNFYEGSDLVDVSITGTQKVKYAYQNMYAPAYQGGGLVLDIQSVQSSPITDDLFINSCLNSIDDYTFWLDHNGSLIEYTGHSPNISIHFSTNSDEPILALTAHSRKILFPYTPLGEVSSEQPIMIQNLGASSLTVSGMSGSGVFNMIPSTVTIPAYSTSKVGFTFNPNEEGTFREKVRLYSNGGETDITLEGSTLRMNPYWHNVTLSSNYSLNDYFYRSGISSDTITALSVTGTLSGYEWDLICRQLPNLKYLDLSTATIPNDFYSSYFAYPENIEQLALPLNYGDWANVDRFVNLRYLMYPMTTDKVYMNEFDNCPYLNSLVVLASTPPNVWNNYKENGITKVYVPASAVDDYKYQGGWQYNNGTQREILPITPEILAGEVEAGSATIIIQDHREYDTSNYPTSKRSIWISPEETPSYVGYHPNNVPTASLQVAPDTPLEVETLGLTYPLDTRQYDNWDGSSYASFINHSTQMSVDQLQLHLKMRNYCYWYFLTVPFSMPLSNLQAKESNASYVIRTYAGDLRATNGVNGYNENWRDLTVNDSLEPGKGYIFQSNGWIDSLLFTAPYPMDYIYNSVYDKTVSVSRYYSANATDKNWNLIGNPYFAFYDIHQMGYSAPIIIRDDDNYVALSPIDDDYALRPLEAFFVQVPDEMDKIRFPHSGQQTTPYITTTRSALRASLNRQVFNLQLLQQGKHDRSRVVLNPEAKGDYEVQCDAAKWMSESDTVPQLYTLDHIGTKYAINERPVGNGIVPLGVRAAADGEMTISLTGDPGPLRLYDKELKREVDLSEGDYTFLARKGTIENRFELRFSSATANEPITAESVRVYANSSQLVVEAPVQMAVAVYSTAGILLRQTTMTATRWSCPLSAGIYVVRVGDTNHKVIIY
ncbi:MAG: DUF6383 domain-containing protein [Parabacteroides sp.]